MQRGAERLPPWVLWTAPGAACCELHNASPKLAGLQPRCSSVLQRTLLHVQQPHLVLATGPQAQLTPQASSVGSGSLERLLIGLAEDPRASLIDCTRLTWCTNSDGSPVVRTPGGAREPRWFACHALRTYAPVAAVCLQKGGALPAVEPLLPAPLRCRCWARAASVRCEGQPELWAWGQRLARQAAWIQAPAQRPTRLHLKQRCWMTVGRAGLHSPPLCLAVLQGPLSCSTTLDIHLSTLALTHSPTHPTP